MPHVLMRLLACRKPEQTVEIEGHTVYFWTVPAKPPDIQN
jgi:hypothetical protein